MKFDIISNVCDWNDLGLFGTLYIEADGHPFPHTHEPGNISETLILWAESLCSMLESASGDTEELFFPACAHSFSIQLSGSSFALICLKHDAKPINAPPVEVSFFSVVCAVYLLIAELISDNRFDGIAHIKRLKSVSARLKKASKSFGFHFE